ncbi:MAG: 2-oxo acid dehydrogenase subunit E2 [Anaerolineaceae bacterium]|nr:2-oxo acid dehydrogenase subunit E2 [Anaerolineaceae bacterium]
MIKETRRGLAVREKRPLNRVQKAMAKGMKASVETLALSQLSREMDVTGLQAVRKPATGGGKALSLNTLIMAAAARTLPAHPLLNAELVESEIVVFEAVNVGMAVATPAGLIVTVIQNADQLSLQEMDGEINRLAGRARSGKLELADIEGGTFTVSNLGMFGVDSGNPLPRPPESAIMLLGAVRPRAGVVDGQVAVRETCWMTVSYDHRFIDGATAAAFLEDLSKVLAEPQQLYEGTRG